MGRIYRLVKKPLKGRGKTWYKPGQVMDMGQVQEYLGVKFGVVRRLKLALLKDKNFKLTRQKLFWIRHPEFKTDFQTVNFLYQRLRWEERKRKRKREEEERYEPEYYQREIKAYLRGELGTSPTSNPVRIRSLGLDPFESR